MYKDFNNDPECRVFLSTDAGGVGLNLQAASLLINLDLPWNPAVLEQRIARIHRLGQKRNVQIINIVAAGTIEEKMLDKLAFKSAMATGILDNGESMVLLGESKFNELMKQVSGMTAEPASPELSKEQDKKEEAESFSPAPERKGPATTEAVLPEQEDSPITEVSTRKNETADKGQINKTYTLPAEAEELVKTGMSFFGKLMETLADQSKSEKLIESLVKQDEKTGETYLKIPVKNQEVIENGLKLLGQLFGGKR